MNKPNISLIDCNDMGGQKRPCGAEWIDRIQAAAHWQYYQADKPLTCFNPDHPYFAAEYDLADGG